MAKTTKAYVCKDCGIIRLTTPSKSDSEREGIITANDVCKACGCPYLTNCVINLEFNTIMEE